MNGSIQAWNISEERSYFQILNDGTSPKMTHWCPTDQDFVAFSDSSHAVRILDLHQHKITKLMQLTSSNSPLPCKWSPKENKILAFGCSDSSVYIYDLPGKKHKKFLKDNRQGVQDLAWNPRQNYLLVAFKNGTMNLLDNKGGLISDFQRQGQGINCVSWIDNMSGDLVTSSPRIGALKVWNASHNRPRNTVKLGVTGVKSLLPFTKFPNRFLVAFKNGAVGIYNFELKKLEFCTEAGHTETVFDLQFKPDNCNILATVSYDGNIKIWDVESLSLIKTLSQAKESPQLQAVQLKSGGQKTPKVVCYGVAWGPQRQDTRIAATNNLGQLVIWDTQKQRILAKFEHTHQAIAVRAKWNYINSRYIAFTVDKYWYVGIDFSYVLQVAENYFEMTYNPIIEVKAKIETKQVLFGLSWNPFAKVELAVSGSSGLLHLYNLEESTKPISQLVGHSGKVADIAWNPHYRSILASCADDKSVRVWDTNANEQICLTGHTHNTRGISWNYQIPWLLLSGSWDSSIRVWDLRTRTTLHVINDHIADVYGIVSHPSRPFVYSSCSRDTTIRLWRLEGFIHTLLLKMLFMKELESIRLQSPPPLSNLLYEEVKIEQVSLCGGGSKNILKLLTDPALYQKAQKSKELMSYLGVYDGQTELFSIIESIREKTPSAESARIVHLSELISVSKSRVEELQSTSNMAYLGTNLAKKQERMLECA